MLIRNSFGQAAAIYRQENLICTNKGAVVGQASNLKSVRE